DRDAFRRVERWDPYLVWHRGGAPARLICSYHCDLAVDHRALRQQLYLCGHPRLGALDHRRNKAAVRFQAIIVFNRCWLLGAQAALRLEEQLYRKRDCSRWELALQHSSFRDADIGETAKNSVDACRKVCVCCEGGRVGSKDGVEPAAPAM